MESKGSPFKGLRIVFYFVDDLEKAKEWYSKVLKIKPYFDELFYVGFNVAGYELGLQPKEKNNGKPSTTFATYWAVDDIDSEFKRIIDLGAEVKEEPMDVGGESSFNVRSLGKPIWNYL